ncbi:MAG: amino acid permease [Bacteroidetes bacterium]|jgi:APA family basic amino acid/polyamine antiporter|nr:amino acid permease [Bacteroidota bacterium]
MNQFNRTISLNTTIAIVIGGVIGSGIFMKPSLMASQLGSPLLLLSVWLVAGMISLFGALSNCELATMFPETGGPFVFFKKIYGNGFAFLYGWAAFAVSNTAGNASIAYVFSEYTNYFVELPRFSEVTEQSVHFTIPLIGTIFLLKNFGVKVLTVIIVLLLTGVNYRGVKEGGALQRILTAMKVVAMILLIGGILFSSKGSSSNILTSSPIMSSGWALVASYMAALSGAFWAYDGWNNITFLAGEIQNPQRSIPRGLFTGLFTCVIIYALINLAYIYVLPIEKISGSSFVASDAATIAWGSIGGSVIALLVMLSTLGATNANILATARTTYALGEGNKLFAKAGQIHPKFKTPGKALLLNAFWSSILIFSGSFDMLTDMLVFVSWFFYGMSALGVIILRIKMKDVHRPYKVWGYPVVPVLFVAFVTFFLISTLYNDICNYKNETSPVINSLLGMVITLIGLPVYYFSRKTNTSL